MAAIVDANVNNVSCEPHSSSTTIETRARSNTIVINTWGQVGHLTPAQDAVFKKFRTEVKPAFVDTAKYTVETFDQCCLRFLRARQFDGEKASVLLTECNNKLVEMQAAYWSQLTPDECANCDIAALKNFYPHVQSGFDKLNRPLLFEHTGRMNPNAILQMSSKKNLINYHWWSMENSLDQKFNEAARRNIAARGDEEGEMLHNISTCVILDFKELGLVHCSQKMMDQMKLYIGLDNTCYPETLGKMLVINAPYLAVQTWRIVKGWLDPRTQQKIEILGASETMARLHEYVALDQLPKMYGGTAPDIYLTKDNAESVTVPRGGKVVKTIDVPKGKTLTVDSYVNEGPLDICITCAGPSGAVVTLSPSVTVTPTEEKDPLLVGPARNLQVFRPTDAPRKVSVTWTNPAKYSGKPLIYVFTLTDPEV